MEPDTYWKTKVLRDSVDEIQSIIKDLKKQEVKNREISLVLTNLEQGEMWLERAAYNLENEED